VPRVVSRLLENLWDLDFIVSDSRYRIRLSWHVRSKDRYQTDLLKNDGDREAMNVSEQGTELITNNCD
jgi:hypothetical protein